jgi:hypothetical protein
MDHLVLKTQNLGFKLLLLTNLVLSITIVFFLLSAAPVNAQDDPVPNPPVPCNEVEPNEYHSLRPYQASPCNADVSDTALFCGDTLTFTDNVEETFPKAFSYCNSTSAGNVRCDYALNRSATIEVDLSGAELPIMGNTEDVVNYKNTTDTLDDAQKLSEYVSWYLSGVPNRKEYPEKTDAKSVVDYSGPIAKLLPQEIQSAIRVETVENATGIDLGSGQESVERNRHNQIVVCTENKTIEIPILGIKIPIPGVKVPGKCEAPYVLVPNTVRVGDWDGDLSGFTTVINFVLEKWGSIADFFADYLKSYPLDQVAQYLQDTPAWNSRVPPLSWNFTDPLLYKKAYNEWQGKLCILIPIPTRFIICTDSFLIPNMWADLFPYIPLSSTEDRLGQAEGNATVGPPPPEVTLSNVVITSNAADLYFSHMEEVKDLATQLQTTYVPKGVDPAAPGNSVPAQIGGSCTIADVRSGAGDNLFAGDIGVNISYHAEFSCDFKVPYCSKDCALACKDTMDGGVCCSALDIAQLKCISENAPTQTCTKSIPVAVNITTKTPLVDKTWTRLVSGAASVFRRMFPKLGAGSSIGEVKDIPASTGVTYTGTINGESVPESAGQLNFPHIGGISEYFLKGIQTALRPKGYGGPISFGVATTLLGGNCDGSVFEKYNPPSQTTSKAKDYFDAYIKPKLTDEVVSVYKEAERQTGIPCEVFAGLHYVEGGNGPNQSLISGRQLGTPEPDEGGRVFTTLLDTATYVADRIKGKVGGDVSTWEKLVTALSRYNGGGNRNCKSNFIGGSVPYFYIPGHCPPLYEGEDDPYALSWFDQKHSQMYLLYCADNTPCTPPQELLRPGVMTVATEFYIEKK